MASGDTGMRLMLADTGATVRREAVPGGTRPQRWMAVACDLGVLVAIGLTFFIAFRQFWMPVAIATLVYYVASIVLLGNTPGMSLCAPGPGRGRAVRPVASLTSSARAVASAIPPDLMLDGSRGARQPGDGSKPAHQSSHHPAG